VFRLDKNGKVTVLYSFSNMSGDGAQPYSGLVRDAAGNLYGTTFYGGDGFPGDGIIFKVDKNGNETVLYTFTGTNDGGGPLGQLVRDRTGNLYGTASLGILGVVFELTP
jgi:uncharacterized repeat protein (TIGR03803 family)